MARELGRRSVYRPVDNQGEEQALNLDLVPATSHCCAQGTDNAKPRPAVSRSAANPNLVALGLDPTPALAGEHDDSQLVRGDHLRRETEGVHALGALHDPIRAPEPSTLAVSDLDLDLGKVALRRRNEHQRNALGALPEDEIVGGAAALDQLLREDLEDRDVGDRGGLPLESHSGGEP